MQSNCKIGAELVRAEAQVDQHDFCVLSYKAGQPDLARADQRHIYSRQQQPEHKKIGMIYASLC